MNLHLISSNSIVCFLLCSLSSLCLISCGMRTSPAFIPEQKAKQTINDLKVLQRDNRVRLSWEIDQTERIKRLKEFDSESVERDYFLIHQKIINLDCRECEPNELTDLKKMPTIKDLFMHTAGFSYNFLADPVGKEYDVIKLFNSSKTTLEEEINLLSKPKFSNRGRFCTKSTYSKNLY